MHGVGGWFLSPACSHTTVRRIEASMLDVSMPKNQECPPFGCLPGPGCRPIACCNVRSRQTRTA